MDSITQATLGAALGETLLARRLGNKALLWGAAIGTLPDLDVLANGCFDSVDRLGWHRGLSHSLLFIAIATPLLVWLMRRVHGERLAGAPVAWFVFANLATHVLVDCFNVYGTQALEPFSDTRVRFGNMFVIDPLLTLPMLLPLLIVMWRKPATRMRVRLPIIGLATTTLYAALSFGCKAMADSRFAAAIDREGIPAQRWLSGAMPLTTVYWRCLVDAGDEFWIGHVSLFDPGDQRIEWRRVPRNADLLGSQAGSRAVERVRWFSEDYFNVRREDGKLIMADLRFGDLDGGTPGSAGWRWIFNFEIGDDGESVQSRRPSISSALPLLGDLLRRSFGG